MTQPKSGHLPIDAPCTSRVPTLDEFVRDAERILDAAIKALARQWDPTTGPQQDGGVLPSAVDTKLAAARTQACIALVNLADVAAMCHPGPIPGVGRSPGYAAAHGGAACESDGTAIPSTATNGTVAPGGAGPDPRRSRAAGARTAHGVAGPPGVGHELVAPQGRPW